ncbi:hypothetical protein TNCV_1256761 [Trichonephila clavipes]|nr:hypothetical protein TNCV_1256761 [Trichonephila clavipes]
MALHSPTENSLAVLNHKILEANSQVQNVKLGGHQTCLSINRLWHELCDMHAAVCTALHLIIFISLTANREETHSHATTNSSAPSPPKPLATQISRTAATDDCVIPCLSPYHHSDGISFLDQSRGSFSPSKTVNITGL